jgi:3-methyladenine DNA glycosylase AlkD
MSVKLDDQEAVRGSPLGQLIRVGLTALADPLKAGPMQAYMKSDMPFLGVSAVPFQKMCKELFANLRYASADAWRNDVLAVWRGAQFREERYAAIALSGLRAAREFQRFEALGMYEEMAVSGAWWDYVDTIATQRLWDLLRNDPVPVKQLMRKWSTGDNIWKRRCAIICQNKAKQSTDLDLLYSCIEPSMTSKEFFLRKGIGWALREYAWTNPEEVRRYVNQNADRLSGLSRREALKNIRHPSESEPK